MGSGKWEAGNARRSSDTGFFDCDIDCDSDFLELKLVDDFVPNPGAVFRIFKYSGDLEGTFAGLPEGNRSRAI